MAKLLLTSTRAVLGTEIFLCTSKDSLRDRLLGTSLDRSRNDDNFLILGQRIYEVWSAKYWTSDFSNFDVSGSGERPSEDTFISLN